MKGKSKFEHQTKAINKTKIKVFETKQLQKYDIIMTFTLSLETAIFIKDGSLEIHILYEMCFQNSNH